MWDTIVILEEGNRPYPPFPKCDMFVSHKAFNGRHLATTFCHRREEWKQRYLAEEEAWAETYREITSYVTPLPGQLLQVPWESTLGGRQ